MKKNEKKKLKNEKNTEPARANTSVRLALEARR